MGKQSVRQRIERILKDAAEGKEGKEIDLRKRWDAVAEDPEVPGIESVLAAVGQMPIATLDDVDRKTAVYYAARDADATCRIAPVLGAKHAAMGLGLVGAIDLAIVPMVERMQRIGMPTNVESFHELGRKMTKLMAQHVATIEEMTGWTINPDSGDQVAPLIFDHLKLPIRYQTKTGKRGSTDDKTLEGLRGKHPVITPILDYRECSKVRNSFAVVLPRRVSPDGRIRCTLRVTRVSSGRLAASGPNLMAIPVRSDIGREVRRGFEAPGGHLLGTCDLDQIEMRVMADHSRDETLCGLFNRGEDVHAQTASWMFGIPLAQVHPMRHRYPAKRVGFGVITGITGHGLEQQLALAGISGYDEAACDEMIEGWFGIYKGVREYQEREREKVRRHGYATDAWGRIRYLPGIHSDKRWVREEAERQSHSHDIQGTAQGILKLGMGEVWRDLLPAVWREGVWMEPLLQIHDELMFEGETDAVKPFMPLVKDTLCSAAKLCVPLKAKWAVGQNWADLEK